MRIPASRLAVPTAAAALVLLIPSIVSAQSLKPFQQAGLDACLKSAAPEAREKVEEEFRPVFAMMPNEIAVQMFVAECKSSAQDMAQELAEAAAEEARAEEEYVDSDKVQAHHMAQLAEPVRRLWASLLPFELALAERDDDMSSFTSRSWDSYAGTPAHYPVINPWYYSSEPDRVPMELEHEMFFSIPMDGAFDFDFSKVPAKIDHAPVLAKLDAMVAAYKSAWIKRNEAASALRTAKYPDERWTGMGRESKMLDKKMEEWRKTTEAEMAPLGKQIEALIEGHRRSVVAPMLQAVKSGTKVKL